MDACLDDTSILALLEGRLSAETLSEAELHLDHCASCRAVVAGVAQLGPSPDEDRIGRYLVLDRLGRGGFGDVVRAYDPGLDRRVAIKRLRVGLEETFRAQLETEARAMAQLNHPHVVTVYEVGSHGGALFIAMELVEGRTLRDWLDEERTEAEVLAVFEQVGKGLSAAHAAGIVHGDVKPANVLLGDDGRARVTDFGLARSGGDDIAGRADLTEGASVVLDGRIVGTPAYMAPEQLAGAAATPSSDQYAFCVALVEALTGTRPFSADSLEDLVAEAPERRWTAPTGWSRARAQALARGLANTPDGRFGSMEALLDALRVQPRAHRPVAIGFGLAAGVAALAMAIAGQPEPCRAGDTLAAETWNDARRHQLQQRFSTEASALADGTMAELTRTLDDWRVRWTGRHREQCLAERDGGDAQVALATQTCLRRQRREVDALLDAFSRGGPSTVARVPEALAALPLPEACDGTEAALSSSEAAALDGFEEGMAQARAALATGDYAEAESSSSRMLAQAARAEHDASRAQAALALGEAELRLGRYDEAERTTLDALWAARRAGDEPTAALAWLQRAAIAGTSGRDTFTEEACQHAAAVASRLGRPRVEARIHNALGVLYTNLGRYDEAKRELDAALRLRTEVHGPDHPEVARTLTNLGNLARSRDDLLAARRYHERARAIDRARLGEDHPNEARHLHNLARLTLLEGDPKRAEQLYLEALRRKEKALGAQHPEAGLTHNSLGLLYAHIGDADRARRHYRRAIDLLSPSRPRDADVARDNLDRLASTKPENTTAAHRVAPAPAPSRPSAALRPSVVPAAAVMPLSASKAPPPPSVAPAPKPHPPAPKPPPVAPPPVGGSYMPGQAWD